MDSRQQPRRRLLPVWRRNIRVSLVVRCDGRSTEEDGPGAAEGNTTLVSLDVATLEQTTITAPPGIKLFPAVLNDGEIAYVRKDSDDRGLFVQLDREEGSAGLVRSPSWSPDGKRVVYHRFLSQNIRLVAKGVEPESRDMTSSTRNAIPAFDPSGKRLIATADNTRTGSNRAGAERASKPSSGRKGSLRNRPTGPRKATRSCLDWASISGIARRVPRSR